MVCHYLHQNWAPSLGPVELLREQHTLLTTRYHLQIVPQINRNFEIWQTKQRMLKKTLAKSGNFVLPLMEINYNNYKLHVHFVYT
jgi:hypothetical protein